MKNISIRIVTENKKEFLPLLLLGDELESQIDKYLERGDMFVLYEHPIVEDGVLLKDKVYLTREL